MAGDEPLCVSLIGQTVPAQALEWFTWHRAFLKIGDIVGSLTAQQYVGLPVERCLCSMMIASTYFVL